MNETTNLAVRGRGREGQTLNCNASSKLNGEERLWSGHFNRSHKQYIINYIPKLLKLISKTQNVANHLK